MIRLYRLLVRVLLPSVAREHCDEMVETAAALAREARERGHCVCLEYWIDEFRALARAARSARSSSRGVSMWRNVFYDLRYGMRLMRRTPALSTIAVLTLALGVGANTAVFSIVNGVLLKPLPYPDAGRLYLIQHHQLNDPSRQGDMTPGSFYDFAKAGSGFAPMAAYYSTVETLTGTGDPQRLVGVRSLGSVLEVLSVPPAIGRVLTSADDVVGAPDIVVISDGLWASLFGRSPDALGRSLVLGGTPHTIVGVMPAGFTFPDSKIDFWAPAHLNDALRTSRTEYFLQVLARLRPDSSVPAATGRLASVMARLRQDYPQANGDLDVDVQTLQDATVGSLRPQFWTLMAAVACVLLIACANLANLMLARASGRTREIAIRQAIGAARARLIRQLIVESLLLTGVGGIAGVLVGRVFLAALTAWLPAGIPRLDAATIDPRVLMFALCITLASGLLFGLAPALNASKSDPAGVLRQDSRTSSARSPLRPLLVSIEFALALILLSGAGLLIRSFILLQRVDPGFTHTNVLTFRTSLEGPRYATAPPRIAFVKDALGRLSALPGVTNAAIASAAPVLSRGSGAWFNILSRPLPPGKTPPVVPYRIVSAGYFETMGIPLVRGRYLDAHDGLDGTPSVVISESVARHFWPTSASGDPIGSEVYLGASDNRLFPHAVIVGIVKDVELSGFSSHITEAVYATNTLAPFWRTFTFVVRTEGDPSALASQARAVVRQADPSMAVTAMQTMPEIERQSMAPARASMLLLTLFAGIAVVMAAIGVFGVMSYTVTLRTREMGIRLALGATPSEVQRLIVRAGLRQALAGAAVGLVGAIAMMRGMTSLLFQIPPNDPVTLACVTLVLLVTAAAASYVPARRATRLDPLRVLRTE